jgi:hypothetical protein
MESCIALHLLQDLVIGPLRTMTGPIVSACPSPEGVFRSPTPFRMRRPQWNMREYDNRGACCDTCQVFAKVEVAF